MFFVICISFIALAIDFVLLSQFPWIALGLNSVVAVCLLIAVKGTQHPNPSTPVGEKKNPTDMIQMMLPFPIAVVLASVVSIVTLEPSNPTFYLQLIAVLLIMQVITGFIISSVVISFSPATLTQTTLTQTTLLSEHQPNAELLPQQQKTQN